MKWFKHDTNARHDIKLKLLEKKHGLTGYAAYFKTLEIIGESIDKENVTDWGFVETAYSIDTLAEEIGIESGLYRDIIVTCDELGLFSKSNGRLYCEKILFRLDEYASKLTNKKKLQKLINQRKKLSGQTPDKLPTVSGQYRARLEQIRTEKIIDKSIGEKSPAESKKEYGNEHVNRILANFKNLYGFNPTDKFPRRSAYNLTQQIQKLLKARGKEPMNGVLTTAIDGYFTWISKQDWAENVQTLDTIRRKLTIFEASLPGVQHEKS